MLDFNDKRPIVISGPSGVGKSTLIHYLLQIYPFLYLSVSHTTRKKRHNEEDGREYFFITKEEFENKIKAGDIFEYQEYNNNYYGTSKVQLNTKDKILVFDWERKGVLAARDKNFNARFVFIWCSKEEVEKRLRKRIRKHILNDMEEKDIQNRLVQYDEDIKTFNLGVYDIGIENRDINDTLKKLSSFLSL